MAANLSNIAFFDISESQFTGIKPLEYSLDFGGNDYTDEYLDELSETYGEEFKSFANFAIQIDVDKKITLGHIGEYILKSESLWNLATRKGTAYPQWYLDLQNAINSTKNVIGSTSSTTRYWTWSKLINGYGGLIPLVEEISSLLGSISLNSDISDTVYQNWTDWKDKFSSITEWIRDNSEYLNKILGSDWTSYDEFNNIPTRILRLENFTGVPTGGSVLPSKSLSQQIEDINTALGNKVNPNEDTIYKRLDDLEKRLYLEDDTISINMSTDVDSEPIKIGGNSNGEIPPGLINYSTVYALFTKTPYVLEPNKRYILNITGVSEHNNNLKAFSFKTLTRANWNDTRHYGLSSVDEAPFISCDLSQLTDGDRVRIECPTHYLLVGVMFGRTVIVLKGSNSEPINPNVPTIYREGFQGEDNYSGLDVSSRIFCKNIPGFSMGGWVVNNSPLDLTRTHILSNFEFNPGKSYIINDSNIPDIAKSQVLKFACPYYIDIEARDVNSSLHYFINITFETNPFIQHLFDSSDSYSNT